MESVQVNSNVKICTVNNTTICTLTKYYCSDQIKKTQMDGACGAYWGERWRFQGFGGETSEKETT